MVKTVYYKYNLDGDWSIRFHEIYKDRKKYRDRWVLKSHFSKDHILITRKIAEEYIEKYNAKPKLIVGFLHGTDYKKIELSNKGELFFYLDNEETPP